MLEEAEIEKKHPIKPFWSKGLEVANGAAPRCGAKTRSNNHLPCRKAAMKNGRCKMHGGYGYKGPVGKEHGSYVHGVTTKAFIAKRKLYDRLAEVLEQMKD